MKAFLLHREQHFDLEAELPSSEEALTQDLELDTLFAAMARGDQFLFEVAKRAVLSSLIDPDAIAHRQAILRDCVQQPDIVREIYDLAVEAILGEKKIYFGIFSQSPDTILYRAIQVLEMFGEMLKRLRQMSDEHAGKFGSEGFVRLFRTLSAELDDEYLQTVDEHLRQLRFRSGTLMSAELGKGNKGTRYVLRRPRKQSWRERIPLGDRSSYSFQIPDRDQNGFRALADLRGRGINLVANASHSQPTTSSASSGCCEPSWASMSAA